MKRRLPQAAWILIAMVAGFIIFISYPDKKTAAQIAGYVSIVTDVFLRLIKMIIAPLVFATLVVGIAHIGDSSALGRIGLKTMSWFVSASLMCLVVAMILVNILRPGDALSLPLPDAGASTNLKAASLSLKEFVTHLVPKSAIEAMANNEILQIVVFSIFFGVALASLGAKGKLLAEGFEQVADVMLRITGYIMNFAPIAVFAAMAAIITTPGLGILVTYGKFMLEFYISLAILWCVLALAGYALMGRQMTRMLSLIREPFILAFSTASSEAAY